MNPLEANTSGWDTFEGELPLNGCLTRAFSFHSSNKLHFQSRILNISSFRNPVIRSKEVESPCKVSYIATSWIRLTINTWSLLVHLAANRKTRLPAAVHLFLPFCHFAPQFSLSFISHLSPSLFATFCLPPIFNPVLLLLIILYHYFFSRFEAL